MAPTPPTGLIDRLRSQLLSAYRKLLIDSGLPGAARNPVLFATFLVREIFTREVSTRAMALSYQLLFCLVPGLTFTVALFALLPGLAPSTRINWVSFTSQVNGPHFDTIYLKT